jgi:uncharacterized protein
MGAVFEIMKDTGCEEDIAKRAYYQSKFDFNESVRLVKDGQVDMTINPDDYLNIDDDDLRFRKIEEQVEPISNAVIIFMCDTSGSMDLKKKYLARSLAFWMHEFIKSKYNHVEVRFIVHTTEAKLVDEDEFFKRGESGGTNCHTAFDLAERLIETEYPTNEYNVYIQYFSDGEDFSTEKTINSVRRLMNMNLNMICYCEITPSDGHTYMWGMPVLMDAMKKEFDLVKVSSDMDFYRSRQSKLFTGIVREKGHIYKYLKHVLFKE